MKIYFKTLSLIVAFVFLTVTTGIQQATDNAPQTYEKLSPPTLLPHLPRSIKKEEPFRKNTLFWGSLRNFFIGITLIGPVLLNLNCSKSDDPSADMGLPKKQAPLMQEEKKKEEPAKSEPKPPEEQKEEQKKEEIVLEKAPEEEKEPPKKDEENFEKLIQDSLFSKKEEERIQAQEKLFQLTEDTKACLAVMPYLLQALKHSDKDIRLDAAGILGQIGANAFIAIPALVETLSDEYFKVRCNAIWALGQMGPLAAQAAPEIKKYLKDPHDHVRCRAIQELIEIEPKDATYLELIPLLDDPFKETKVFAKKMLIEVVPKNEAVLKELVKILETKTEKQQEELIEILFDAAQKSSYAANELNAILKGTNEKRKMMIFKNFFFYRGDVSWALPGLEKTLEDSNEKIIEETLEAIASIGEKAEHLLPKILKFLKHPSYGVREEAVSAIGSIGKKTDEIISLLLIALKDKEIFYVRRPVAKALIEIRADSSQVVESLITALKDPENSSIDDCFVEALGSLGQKAIKAIPIFKKRLKTISATEPKTDTDSDLFKEFPSLAEHLAYAETLKKILIAISKIDLNETQTLVSDFIKGLNSAKLKERDAAALRLVLINEGLISDELRNQMLLALVRSYNDKEKNLSEKTKIILTEYLITRKKISSTRNEEDRTKIPEKDLKEIQKIFFNETFINETKGLKNSQRTSIAIAVYHNLLRYSELKLETDTIQKLTQLILEVRKEYGEWNVFGKDVSCINSCHDEFSFDDVTQLELERGVDSSKIHNFKGIKYKQKIMSTIINVEGPLTHWLFHHGSPGHFWFGVGRKARIDDSKEIRFFRAISSAEYASALAKRKDKKSPVILVVTSCFGWNTASEIIKNVEEADVNYPIVIVTAGNKDAVCSSIKEDDLLLLFLRKVIHIKKTPHLKNFFEVDNFLFEIIGGWIRQDLSVSVYIPKSLIEKKLDIKLSTPPSDKKFLEIGKADSYERKKSFPFQSLDEMNPPYSIERSQ